MHHRVGLIDWPHKPRQAPNVLTSDQNTVKSTNNFFGVKATRLIPPIPKKLLPASRWLWWWRRWIHHRSSSSRRHSDRTPWRNHITKREWHHTVPRPPAVAVEVTKLLHYPNTRKQAMAHTSFNHKMVGRQQCSCSVSCRFHSQLVCVNCSKSC